MTKKYHELVKQILFNSLIPRDIIFTNLAPASSDWFDPVNFKGAFGTYKWATSWTLLSQEGLLKD